ncbi:MAG: hypothetical protein GC189_05215 [Alphaproteobacteria bacterium]|nr:hypothetical protein [Alphaproteobacteria bacterium]
MSVIDLAPIVKTIIVRRSAVDAFRLFTEEMSAWWPLRTHSRARSADGETAVRVTVEPCVGGRVFETLRDGRALEWGEVTAYEPGAHFAMRWTMGRAAGLGTDVSVRFDPTSDGTCRVTLQHDHWERLGDDGAVLRGQYDSGWIAVFERGFGAHAGLAA